MTLTAHDVAYTDCDLSLFDAATQTLLAGDLLFVEGVPALDGRIKAWQQVLHALKQLAVVRAVPGHGPVSVNWLRSVRKDGVPQRCQCSERAASSGSAPAAGASAAACAQA